jgi:hypothetical protein
MRGGSTLATYRKKWKGWHRATPDEQERHLEQLERSALAVRRADVAQLYAEMRRRRKARRERG